MFEAIAMSGHLVTSPILRNKTNDSHATETVGLMIRNLEICHQGNWRNMTFQIQYETASLHPSYDVGEVRAFMRHFLDNYPNTTDFWEVINRNLVLALSEKCPDIQTIQSKLAIAPDQDFSFPRESIVYYSSQSGIDKEAFHFTKLNYPISDGAFRSIDFHVIFNYKEDPTPSDYPDYQWIDGAINEFLEKESFVSSKWEETKPRLEAFLRTQFPTLTCIDVEISHVT